MSNLSDKAMRVASLVDDIESYNYTISDLESQICDGHPEDPASLTDEQKRLQEKVNTMTNNLKDEGVEIVYDGRLTQVRHQGNLWLEQYHGQGGYGWVEYDLAKKAVSLRDYWLS